jgi:alkylation response protein AidB-like acyl-CoA dehydrogenase
VKPIFVLIYRLKNYEFRLFNELQQKLREFMDAHIYPNEKAYEGEINTGDRWQPSALIEDLKRQARAEICGICFCRKFPV